MKTITQSLFAVGRSIAPLTDEQSDRLTTTLAAMGIDPRDCNGATLSGMTSSDMMRIGMAIGDNSRAGDIVVASETDGTRLAIVEHHLQLLPQD